MKLLITGGCSFSECLSVKTQTWPKHLATAMPEYTHVSTGLGSQGNGLISRKLIHAVQNNINANDLLVGVIWSGPDRHDFYINSKKALESTEQWQINPTSVVPESPGSWIILNPWWDLNDSKIYYETFHDSIGQLVYTYEHILRTQWFLEKHNIKYFMSTHTSEVFPQRRLNHPELLYLYNMIDHSKFLPVEGIYEWCRDFSGLEFPTKGDLHPSSEHHGLFTQEVIIPFLKEKNYI